MNYNKYAQMHNLVTDYDVLAHIHAGLRSNKDLEKYHSELQKLQQAREQGKQKYKKALIKGEFEAPKVLSYEEKLQIAAKGHPDLKATQAAIRLLEKRKCTLSS